jgi:hypothetical protein
MPVSCEVTRVPRRGVPHYAVVVDGREIDGRVHRLHGQNVRLLKRLAAASPEAVPIAELERALGDRPRKGGIHSVAPKITPLRAAVRTLGFDITHDARGYRLHPATSTPLTGP